MTRPHHRATFTVRVPGHELEAPFTAEAGRMEVMPSGVLLLISDGVVLHAFSDWTECHREEPS